MTNLDALLAGCALALTVLLALLALRDAVSLPQGRALAALAISVSAQAIASLPIAHLLPAPAYVAARIVGAPNVGLLWWFCLVLLRDDFRLGAFEWTGMVALSIAPATYLLADLGVRTPMPAAVSIYGSIAPLVMVGQVVWVAVRERESDLLEPRRRARAWIVGACLLALVVSLGTEEMRDSQLASVLRNALVGIPMTALVLLWLMSLRIERLQFIERLDAPLINMPPVSTPRIDPPCSRPESRSKADDCCSDDDLRSIGQNLRRLIAAVAITLRCRRILLMRAALILSGVVVQCGASPELPSRVL